MLWNYFVRMYPVDNLWTTRRALCSNPVDNSSVLDSSLTSSVRSIAVSERVCACSSRVRLHLSAGLCLVLGALLINMQPVQAATQADQYRLYAHSRIIQWNEFNCFAKIIHKESRWNPKARNGSHFGLGQMRSQWYRNLDPYRQIDQTLIYISNRYQTPCKAWAFHERKGWF
jgi:hypothetical protein